MYNAQCNLCATHNVIDVYPMANLKSLAKPAVSEDQREGLSSLPHLLQKIMSIKGHSQGIVKFLSLLVDPASHAALET